MTADMICRFLDKRLLPDLATKKPLCPFTAPTYCRYPKDTPPISLWVLEPFLMCEASLIQLSSTISPKLRPSPLQDPHSPVHAIPDEEATCIHQCPLLHKYRGRSRMRGRDKNSWTIRHSDHLSPRNQSHYISSVLRSNHEEATPPLEGYPVPRT